MNKRVLVIAYYFPPLGLSGVQRVSKFIKYLPEYGWDVSVLTVKPGGYFAFDNSLLDDVERNGVSIHRTASIDPTRLFGSRRVQLPGEKSRQRFSKISQTIFQPDNKIGWYPFAVSAGKKILRDTRHDAILSSAPPYTDHLIGFKLSNQSGLPLVLDYRDDWIENPRHDYPSAAHKRKAEQLEERVLSVCKRVVTINPFISENIVTRSGGRISPEVITHGFDPEDFETDVTLDSSRMNITYSGVFYDAQQPDTFLRGLGRYLSNNPGHRNKLVATFVGDLPDAAKKLVNALGLNDVVEYRGYLNHDEAVVAIKHAHVLWMTIGHQVGSEGISTGKLYEYFGTRKPIIGLVPPGVAAASLVEYGASQIVDPDDVEGTSQAIARCFSEWKSNTLPRPEDAFVSGFNRKRLAARLGNILNEAIINADE